MLRNIHETSARNVLFITAILTGFAAMIAVGVVYNNARIALPERTWELASLRVLGFTRGEVSALLLGELALEIVVALPLGRCLGLRAVVGDRADDPHRHDRHSDRDLRRAPTRTPRSPSSPRASPARWSCAGASTGSTWSAALKTRE